MLNSAFVSKQTSMFVNEFFADIRRIEKQK